MKTSEFLYIILVTIMLAVGQLLFKKAAMVMQGEDSIILLIKHSLTNIWLISAVILYFLATIIWVLILRYVPLSVAYPFTAITFVVVPLASYILYADPYSWRLGLASILIFISIFLIGYEYQ